MPTNTKPAKFAEGTGTSIARTREEIERTLKRYGATGFLYGNQGDVSAVAFELEGRRYRIEVHVPPVESFRAPPHKSRADAQEQEERRLWRALFMVIKAKLEAAKSGIATLEDEFLANVVMPNNETVGQWMKPQIEEVYRTGKMPPLMPGLGWPAYKQLPGQAIDGEIVDRDNRR